MGRSGGGGSSRPSHDSAKSDERAAGRTHGRGRDERGRATGERGIRTLDTGVNPYAGLANRCLQPLGHLSKREARDGSRASGRSSYRVPPSGSIAPAETPAGRVGFEPTRPLRVCRFSRPDHSTTLTPAPRGAIDVRRRQCKIARRNPARHWPASGGARDGRRGS